jgi:hypothetical protein
MLRRAGKHSEPAQNRSKPPRIAQNRSKRLEIASKLLGGVKAAASHENWERPGPIFEYLLDSGSAHPRNIFPILAGSHGNTPIQYLLRSETIFMESLRGRAVPKASAHTSRTMVTAWTPRSWRAACMHHSRATTSMLSRHPLAHATTRPPRHASTARLAMRPLALTPPCHCKCTVRAPAGTTRTGA